MADPRFVFPRRSASGVLEALSLLPDSPARDAGNDARLPADVTIDLLGAPRISGAHVDIGAYELAPEPSGFLAVATAVLTTVALRTRRRRPGVVD